jgi:Tfp pilus assembly protein PilV
MTTSPVLNSTRWRATGVSLIEALVALAVMAFGILGVVGMQSNMRTGADISRQRSEAVRIAQEEMEQLRDYSVLLSADRASGQRSFEQIASVAAASAAASNANTTFFVETVASAAVGSAMAPVRQVRVIVTWADRSASTPNQRIELTSAIAGLPAEMSALHAMRTDRSPLRQFKGRNSAIPKSATDNGDGTSRFDPPGLTGVTWIFNNSTGLITQICSPYPTCTDTQRWLLSGYVAFATGAMPTSSEAEAPVDDLPTGVNLSMVVKVLEPSYTADESCAIGTVTTPAARRVYYCAVPTEDVLTDRYWSGRVEFGTLPLSGTLSDKTATNYKVCRYTPASTNVVPTPPDTLPTVPTGQSVGDYNSRHPYIYYRANVPLQNKNFLVISAGNGTADFVCPAENSATAIESNTWPHQPIN